MTQRNIAFAVLEVPKQAPCPKCGGKLFLDQDYYGWYAQCLLCGHLQNLDKIPELSSKLRHSSGNENVQVIKSKGEK